jgi:hypothetical protein
MEEKNGISLGGRKKLKAKISRLLYLAGDEAPRRLRTMRKSTNPRHLRHPG